MVIPDSDGLQGRAAIVCGAGATDDGIGNGRAAAILMAKRGVSVLAVDREIDKAERTVEMIREAGGVAEAFAADITQETACAEMVDAAVSRFGRLDILDNNVGIGSRGSVLQETAESWENILRINVTAMALAAKCAIPAMIETGGGAIVNISSISALRPRGLTTYTTTKGAVIALTQAMAVDHGADGIRVNCIAPGPVYTPMVYSRGMSDHAREARAKASALKIEGTGWDIGHAVVFLVSDHARYITGQTLVVDGGVTLLSPERDSAG